MKQKMTVLIGAGWINWSIWFGWFVAKAPGPTAY